MRIHRSLIAGLAAAGALGVGLLLAPASQAAQQANEPPMITVSGTAVNPDGTPGANLPVAIKVPAKQPAKGEGAGVDPPEVLSQGERPMKVLAKGTTDSQGKFSLKFAPPSVGSVTLEVGESSKTAWAKQTVATQGKDVDLGRIQLKAPIPAP